MPSSLRASSVDLNKIQKLIDTGYVSMGKHPEYPLHIYNYTQKTQFEKNWTTLTKMCRGLITTPEGVIVARGMPKFMNLEELSKSWNPPSKSFTVTEKMDGSLGIMYPTPDGPAIATRGSFVSDQAIKATQMLIEKYWDYPWDPENYTYLFEIIYPENRIVINYGDFEGLVMLAVLDRATGKDVPPPEWFPNRVEQHEVSSIYDLKVIDAPNREGFVVCYKNGFRLKIKFENYVVLHRIMTGLTARTVWDMMRKHSSYGAARDELTKLLAVVPEEFTDWAMDVFEALVNQHALMLQDTVRLFATGPVAQFHNDRKQFALFANTYEQPWRGLLFKMLDKGTTGLWDPIWPHIKPGPEKFTAETEDDL